MNHFPVLLPRNCATKPLPSTTLYCTACTKHVPVLLCTTKLAQNTSKYYFVLQKACTKHFPVLLCYYKACRKLLPSTTLYYKACTKHFPVLLCTTKLAQTKHVPVLYFVLQSLHKGVGNCSSKTGSRCQSDKKTILKHFLKGILKGKLLSPKLRQSADKSLSQPGCSHSNTIYCTIFSCKRQ